MKRSFKQRVWAVGFAGARKKIKPDPLVAGAWAFFHSRTSALDANRGFDCVLREVEITIRDVPKRKPSRKGRSDG